MAASACPSRRRSATSRTRCPCRAWPQRRQGREGRRRQRRRLGGGACSSKRSVAPELALAGRRATRAGGPGGEQAVAQGGLVGGRRVPLRGVGQVVDRAQAE